MRITGGFKDDKGEGLKIIGQLWNEHVVKWCPERSQEVYSSEEQPSDIS